VTAVTKCVAQASIQLVLTQGSSAPWRTSGSSRWLDEATGYQEVRHRAALQAILDLYLAKELAAWAKRFPDEFYREMFRLRGWEWKPTVTKRTHAVAKYTNDLVYLRLAPDLLKELEQLNPKDDKGHRKVRHHQWLTEDVGHPSLAQHLRGDRPHAGVQLLGAIQGLDRPRTASPATAGGLAALHPSAGGFVQRVLAAFRAMA
jgi:hypothetical protein